MTRHTSTLTRQRRVLEPADSIESFPDQIGVPRAPARDVGFAPSGDLTGRKENPPTYPDAARAQCAFGIVHVRVTVAASGSVTGAVVDRSWKNEHLDAAAVAAARRFRYNPGAAPDGTPMGGDVAVPINSLDPCMRP